MRVGAEGDSPPSLLLPLRTLATRAAVVCTCRARTPHFGMRVGAEGSPPPSLLLLLSTPCRTRPCPWHWPRNPLLGLHVGAESAAITTATATAEPPLPRTPQSLAPAAHPPLWHACGRRGRPAAKQLLYASALHYPAHACFVAIEASLRKYSHEPSLSSLRLCRRKCNPILSYPILSCYTSRVSVATGRKCAWPVVHVTFDCLFFTICSKTNPAK
jgi:hypothetical protein